MNYIFAFLILFSFICAAINGKMEAAVDDMFFAAKKAVEIALSLIGVMGFWLGIVKIAEKSGLMDLFSKIIKKPILLLFPDLKENKNAISNIAANISANALGLCNAATPFGIKAMEDMQKENDDKETATNSMCTFLAVNTAGFQIVPATVLAILIANKMDKAYEIILPTLITTSITFLAAVFFVKILEKLRIFK